MTGWGALIALVGMVVAFAGGVMFGAQWVRDEIAAQARFAAEAERRRRVLPLTYAAPVGDARRGFRVVHGGRR